MDAKTHCLKKRAIVVVICLGILTGFQKTASAEKVLLTLPQLIDMAIAKSPEIKEVDREVASARSDLDQVKAAYYPQIEALGVTSAVRDAKEPMIRGSRIEDPSPGLSFSNIGIFGRLDFTATQPLYTFGKISNRKEAANRGVKAKEHGVGMRKNEIALRVKQLYYGLIVARSGIEAAGDADSFFEDARERMKGLLEAGSDNVMESDLYRVDAYRAETLRSRAEAEKGAQVAYFALKAMIQAGPDVEFDVDQKTLSAREEGLANLESYIERSLKERPEFKQLEEALAAQEYQIRAAESDRYPSFFVALTGSFAGAPGRETFRNAYISDEFNHANFGGFAGVKWNFDFGISKARVEKERAEYERLVYTRSSGRLNIPVQVAKAYQEALEWKKAVETYRVASTASRRWVVAALTNFDMGVGTADDMLRAIERYGANQGKYIEALFNRNLSLAELEYAAGTW